MGVLCDGCNVWGENFYNLFLCKSELISRVHAAKFVNVVAKWLVVEKVDFFIKPYLEYILGRSIGLVFVRIQIV
jgi:hypothetical protein